MDKLATLLRTFGRTTGREHQLTPFLRGISMGALVGAAIAGSAIWRRREQNVRPSEHDRPEHASDRP